MGAKLAAMEHLCSHAGGDAVITRKRKAYTVHLSIDHCKSLFSVWIEASHNKAQHEGVWVIKQAKQLSSEFRFDRFKKQNEAGS